MPSSQPTSAAASNLINLQSLIDLSAALNASDDDAFIFNTSLLSVMGKLRTFKACALMKVKSDDGATNVNEWFCIADKGFKIPENIFFVGVEPSADAVSGALQTLGVTVTQIVSWSKGNAEQDGEESVVILCFGEKLDKTLYTDEERQYISLVASITSNALGNAANMRSLRETGAFLERKNQLLTTLFEVNREFSSLLDKDEIIKFLSLRLMGQLAVTRFALLTKNAHSLLEISANRLGITADHLAGINRTFAQAQEQMSEHGTEQEIEQGTEQGAEQFHKHLTMHCASAIPGCALVVPMTVQNEVKGLLLIGAKMNKQPFSLEEEHFLEALASTAMTALENARLFHEELEKKRLEDELNLARQIQQGLLPTELPTIAGFDLAAMSISSKQTGGDYYDVIPLSPHEYIIVIADVSGKGAPAALLMANTQAALRALTPLRLPLPELVSRLNDLLYANTSSDKFVTLFCCHLNTTERTLTFVNGGHNPPMLVRSDGALELLSDGGLVLGIMESLMPYEQGTVRLAAGDVVLMYTDGVSEALNLASEEFSEAKTEAALRRSTHTEAAQILEAVKADVEDHAAGAPQSDDITMVVVKCV
jgi:sigma-B regulation protein RsbU (phosphoserine phosphatase)